MAKDNSQIVDDEAVNKISKRLKKNIAVLDEMQRQDEKSVYKDLRQAKAITETGFNVQEKYRQAKMERLAQARESGKGIGRTRMAASAAGSAAKSGGKQAVGMLQSDKLFSKQGVKSVAGFGLEGMMHAVGAASGNPLFNLMATGLGSRRKRVQEARQNLYDEENKQEPKSKPEPTEPEDVTEPLAETAAISADSEEHLQLIRDNTKYAVELLEEMAMAAMMQQEALEDKTLDEKNIVKAEGIDAKKTIAAGQLPKPDEDAEGDGDTGIADVAIGNMVSSMMTKFLTKGNLMKIVTALGTIVGTAGFAALITAGAAYAFPKVDEAILSMSESRAEGETDEELLSRLSGYEAGGYTRGNEEEVFMNEMDEKVRDQIVAELARRGVAYELQEFKNATGFSALFKGQNPFEQTYSKKFVRTPKSEDQQGPLDYWKRKKAAEAAAISSAPPMEPPVESTPLPKATPVQDRIDRTTNTFPGSEAARTASDDAKRKAAESKAAQPVIIQGGSSQTTVPQGGPSVSPTPISSGDGGSFDSRYMNTLDH